MLFRSHFGPILFSVLPYCPARGLVVQMATPAETPVASAEAAASQQRSGAGRKTPLGDEAGLAEQNAPAEVAAEVSEFEKGLKTSCEQRQREFPVTVLDPKDKKELEELQTALNINVKPRSAVGQRFDDHLEKAENGDQRAEYNAIKGKGSRDKKLELRVRWVNTQIVGIIRRTKTKMESYEEINEDAGVFMALECVAREEGGTESATAWRAAMNYARKCQGLGGRWLRWNDFTCRSEVFYVKTKSKQVRSEKWLLQEQHEADPDPIAPLASASSSDPQHAPALEQASPRVPETPEKVPKQPKRDAAGNFVDGQHGGGDAADAAAIAAAAANTAAPAATPPEGEANPPTDKKKRRGSSASCQCSQSPVPPCHVLPSRHLELLGEGSGLGSAQKRRERSQSQVSVRDLAEHDRAEQFSSRVLAARLDTCAKEELQDAC